MKRVFSMLLGGIMLISMLLVLPSCATGPKADQSKMVLGVTEFEPMNYRDSNGNWAGFDTQFALLVGEKLGMEVEFQLIEWSNKFIELDSGAIDAIWNGFTATAEEDGIPRIDLCDMSYSYMFNTQSIVVRSDRVGEFMSERDIAGITLAAESGSAGESKAKRLVGESGEVIGVPKQINTLMEVMSGASDAAIIDIIMANQLVGTGSYADLAIADIDLGYEVYAIGFRSGDSLRDKVNEAILELYNEGKLHEIARKYDLEHKVELDTSFGQ